MMFQNKLNFTKSSKESVMARNMAKRFATMTLVYWNPRYGGTGITHEPPITFKGFYIGNARLGYEGIVGSDTAKNENLVLFYLCEPLVEGYVLWDTTLTELEEQGISQLPPSHIPNTHKIKKVIELVMPRTKVASLANKAFIASVE